MRRIETTAFALFFRSDEERQRARVGDQQPSFGVGEQNRVGDRVDDAVEQRALSSLLAVAVGERLETQQLVDFLAEDVREPVQFRPHWCGPADEQQAEHFLREAEHTKRNDVERAVFERRVRPAPAIGRRVRRWEEQLLAVSERRDERVRPVLERDRERGECRPGKPAGCDDEQRRLAGGADKAD